MTARYASPADHLRQVITALETGEADDAGVNVRLNGDTARWLHDGMIRYREGDRGTLCIALALRRVGVESHPKQYARETRNDHLRRAYAHIDGKSPNKRVKALSAAIFQFETRTWPRVRHEAEPPSRLTSAQSELFHAFRAYGRVPTSTSQLNEIVR